MTSNKLKHEAKKREWSIAIQDCRSSGLWYLSPISHADCRVPITELTLFRVFRNLLKPESMLRFLSGLL